MIEYILGEPIPISDTEKIFKYKVKDILYTGNIVPEYKEFINFRLSSTFNECEFFNLEVDYKPTNKTSKGFLNDFIKDNTLNAVGKIDVIIDNPNFSIINNRFCIRDIKTSVTLVKNSDKYFWKIMVKNYDIFDKLVEKVSNIKAINLYADIYEKDTGISLNAEKNKIKVIIDFYYNLLNKKERAPLVEEVKNALRFL
tara:strand:+ start:767 stop:1360 length:594 start_codon:yes stop_codon:yes gene_type:complete